MKKLLTSPNGGFPFVLDDIRWAQDGFNECVQALASVYGQSATSFILSGCKLTIAGGNVTLTTGYVYHAGEVYKVHGYTGSHTAGNIYYLEVQSTFDPSGTKTYQDSAVHDAYEIREMYMFVDTVAQPTMLTISTLKTARQILGVGYEPIPWTDLPCSYNTSGQALGDKPQFMRDSTGTVYLRGWFNGNVPSGQPMFTLPPEARPKDRIGMSLFEQLSNGTFPALLSEVNGQLNAPITGAASIWLYGITPFKVY